MSNNNINGYFVNGQFPTLDECKEVLQNADAICFDVDSTVMKDEGIDRLAEYCGKSSQVQKLTEEAMKGELDFRAALRARLDLIRPSLSMVKNYIRDNPPLMSKNIGKFVAKLQERNVEVFLVSGGFRTLIAPAAKQLDIPLENIYANRLKFFSDGGYAGFDEAQPTSRNGGKAEVITILKERFSLGQIVMIGDGITDLEACPPADAFIGYGGNKIRENVRNLSSWYVTDFAELIDELSY